MKLKEINRLAFPAIIAGIAEPVISLVDTAFIGRIGTAELAAVGIASSFYMMIIWVLSQTKSAISAIVSRNYGKNSLDSIQTLIPQAFYVNAFLGIVVLFITLALLQPILHLYHADGDVFEYATSYYWIRSWGFPLTLATFILFGVFRGLQNTSWAMQISLVGGLVNVIADYVLIFGKWGLPEMGVEGAAAGSLIAQGIMLILAIVVLYKKTPYNLKLVRKWHKDLKWLLGMSLDFYIRTISLNLALYQSTRMASALGDAVVAAHTIAINIWLFSAFFIDGYANAANALSGRLFGEGNYIGLKSLAKKITWIAVGIASLLALVYGLNYYRIGKVFSDDAWVLTYFEQIFFLVILMQPINAVAFAYDGVFKGLGQAKLLRNALLISTFLVFFPFAWISDYLGWGFYAVWGALTLWMISRSTLLVVLFKRWLKPYLANSQA